MDNGKDYKYFFSYHILMKTKWDILFALFELKEAKLSAISKKSGGSPSGVRQKLLELMRIDLVLQEKGNYLPNKKNSRIWNAFNIMKFCRNKGINYNIFLSQEMTNILRASLGKEEAYLSDFKNMDAKTARKYLTYLNRVNLLFITSKKPLTLKLVSDPIFNEVLGFFGVNIKPKAIAKSRNSISAYKEIDSLLRKLKSIGKDLDLKDYEDEFKIEFTSASTQLEGNTFTLEESKELILHDIIPKDKKLKEANEVRNYYNAVGYLFSHLGEPMSISFILDIHQVMTYNLNIKAGIRSSRVSIAGNPFYKVSDFSSILSSLDSLCSKINAFVLEKHNHSQAIEFASFVHNEFQHIHPFEDGNSRMTRLIWNYVLMRNGFPLINIYSNSKQEYLSLTKLSRARDDSKLNSFLVKIIKDNLYKRLRI